ncbi:beta-galactosidase 6-like [Zingiber officinale]|uniref:beta-galactosidase 6-like n=1 Tax=Zingiber officinale TaxID=94328 RepID=UPI001C4C3502|nr:beta-galactosidase 6-like [Zingiber officinale]
MAAAMAPTSLLVLVLLILCHGVELSAAANVTYDHRALVIDGRRRVLVSGSIHYPRSTPEMWPDLIEKSKSGGLDVIDTYVFWDIHEPVQGEYDFEGRKDLVRFVKAVAAGGLYVHLRIGPYVCAEWNYGGFPLWLHFIPGIEFRTDNEPYKKEMQRFTTKIVDMMKYEKLYASQGGPIILSQIENEYGNIDDAYGKAAKTYIDWAASMATSLNTGVPWVMCQQADAPDPIIDTCNGFYCDQYTPNSYHKPKFWTENWSGWFLGFGDSVPYRPAEDLAFAVARFYQRGGTLQNYYMYHGGTNFGRTSGGPFITTSYDYDAPIDEYGLVRQPKWGHLRDLHIAIKLCEEAMVATDPESIDLGPNLIGDVYRAESGKCAAFLANIDNKTNATVIFNGKTYFLPAWSVSILPDCEHVVFNTAQINSQTTLPEMKYVNSDDQSSELAWKYVKEPVGISKSSAFVKAEILEQINTTADASDYLWYSTSLDITGNEPFLSDGSECTLHVESLGHVLHSFVNGQPTGSAIGSGGDSKVSLNLTITLVKGINKIDLLSVTVGLQNYGAFYEKQGAGIISPVLLIGKTASANLSLSEWTYQIGLQGEDSGLYDSGDSSVWHSQADLPKYVPLVWYTTEFEAPAGNDPVAIDFTGMGKGTAWVNGESIGRYWPSYLAPESGCEPCDYRGNYDAKKCRKNCGQPSQTLYHVPRSFIRPGQNKLVLFEEMGGDPTIISFTTRQIARLCGHVSENHPPPVRAWNSRNKSPVLHLECPRPDQVISSVPFASFGTPYGTCGSYSHGGCSSSRALAIVKQACVGATSCDVEVSIDLFGDPCAHVGKSLAVEVACS